MKNIPFIDADMESHRFLGIDKDVILECDHELKITRGIPRSILGCSKCGWWQFYCGESYSNGHLIDLKKYNIVDETL